jgi:hypothetical protein
MAFSFTRIACAAATAGAAVVAVVAGSPAYAATGAAHLQAHGHRSYSHVALDIQGGSSRAVGTCLVRAQNAARSHRPMGDIGYCNNQLVEADGGTVNVRGVDIVVETPSTRHRDSYSDVDINISGGNSRAVAACTAVLHHVATGGDLEACANQTVVSHAGDVNLTDVTLAVTTS